MRKTKHLVRLQRNIGLDSSHPDPISLTPWVPRFLNSAVRVPRLGRERPQNLTHRRIQA